MRIKLPVHAVRKKLKDNESPYVVLKELDRAGRDRLVMLFNKKSDWEKNNKKEFFLWVEFDLRYQERTYKQLRTVWKLVEIIWASMEQEPPTEEEKYELYDDLLHVYADKRINRFGEKVPVRISQSNSIQGARFIDGLLYHISTLCHIDYDAQCTVVDVLHEWEEWRGSLEADPMDYSDVECTRLLTEFEWRERRTISEASGTGGAIERCHIVSRGADARDIEMPWNWLALTHDEHMQQHQMGWDGFLRIYPHLKGRVDRARRLAEKLDLDFKSSQLMKTKSLAMEAIEV